MPKATAATAAPATAAPAPRDWDELARGLLTLIADHYFDVRWGTLTFADVVIAFSNHHTGRTREDLDEIRTRLSIEGYAVLATATYPTEGEDKDYSWAVLVPADNEIAVREILDTVVYDSIHAKANQ